MWHAEWLIQTSIKLNMTPPRASYATARVLFQDPRAAASAIMNEVGLLKLSNHRMEQLLFLRPSKLS